MKKLVAGGVLVVVAVVAWLLWQHGGAATVARTTTITGSAASTSPERAQAAVPASLAGRVVKADGVGIAGAVVAITEGGLGGELTPDKPPILVTSDPTGAWLAPHVPPGGYVATAAAAGFVPGQTAKLWLASGEHKEGVTITLAAGGTLVHGTVSDIGGGPIPGARVSVHVEDRFDWDVQRYVAITNAQGQYELSLADGTYGATAQHDDYTKRTESFDVEGKPVTQDFVLTPGGMIRGQVIARDTNKPVPLAMITAAPQHGRFDGGMPNATADADGNFTVKSLRAGVIGITAHARGYASTAPTTVELGIGEELDNVRVVVDRAYTISGTTVKKGTKTGVSGVHIGVFSMQGGQAIDPDPSDAKGRWEIVGVKRGSYIVFAFGEGSVPNIGKQVQVADKDVSDVELEIEGGTTISGRVAPPQAAAVTIELAGAVGLATMFEAVKTMMVHGEADPTTGAFTLHNVPAGAYKLVARATAGPVGTLPIAVTEVDQHDVVVPLEVRAAISGRVIDTTGAPVAGGLVTAKRTDDAKDVEINFGGERGRMTTRGDGTFRIIGLEAGTYRLTAHADRSEEWTATVETPTKPNDITLTAGEDKTGITLTIPAHTGVIRGTVIGGDKQPVADAWVTAKRVPAARTKDKPEVAVTVEDDSDPMTSSEWWPSSEPVLTGADGKFTISKLRDATYLVVADGPRGSSRAEKRAKPGDTITIELAPLGMLSGKVTAAGAPVVGYTIDCRGPAGAVDRSSAASDGAYTLEHLAPGAYSCSVEADGGTATGKIDVPASAATLDLALVPWASVTGVVVSMFDHAPLPGLGVVAGAEGNQSAMMDVITGTTPKTDAAGRFTLTKVASGKGMLLVMADSGFKPLATKPYTAINGQRVDLGTIEIVPPRQGDAGTFGMTVEPTTTNDGLTVVQVKPGGPAAGAGLVAGDTITTIAGRSVKELGAPASAQYLSSGSIGIGATVQLGLARGVTIAVTSIKW